MEFKEVSYNPQDILKTISSKGRRKADDPTKFFSDKLKDPNIIYFYYNNDKCLYVGESNTCLWNRIISHEDRQKDSKWFKESNCIKIILLDKNVDVYSRKNIESCFIVNLLRAGHKLYNKK